MANDASHVKLLWSIPLALLLSGCVLPSDSRIVSRKIRVFGIMVSENPATQVPEVYLGFVSVVSQSIPVSTNKLYSARYADTFAIGQGLNPFTWNVQENTAAGDMLASNSVIVPFPKLISPTWDNSWQAR